MLENAITGKMYPGLLYDVAEGAFYRLKADTTVDRRIFPNNEGNLLYSCAITGKKIKRSASRVAWEILYDISSTGLHVIHRDLSDSYRASNLCALSKLEYRQFKDALDNTSGYVKMLPNPKDAFGYIVRYKRAGKTRKRIVHDVVSALNFKKKVQFISLKILGKYLSSA